MTIARNLSPASIFDWLKLGIMGTSWFGFTVGILCIMEVWFTSLLL